MLRIPKKDPFVKQSGANRQPEPAAFALSSSEKIAVREGRRVAISVWDRAKITVEAARGLRGDAVVDVFELAVDEVRAIASDLNHPELDVIEDHAGATGPAEPHRLAHAGISGLDRKSASRPVLLDEARDRLARICRAID